MRKSLVLWLSWQIPCLSRGWGAGMPVVDNFNNSNDCGEKFQTQDDLETHNGTNIVINRTVVQHPVQVAPFLG